MRSTYKQLYYINRSKVKSDGTTSIMCRTIDGKAVALSTGLYCQPEEWNSKKGEVKNNRLNGMLCEYKKRVDDETYAELLKVNGVISAELSKTAMTGTADIPKYILQAGKWNGKI